MSAAQDNRSDALVSVGAAVGIFGAKDVFAQNNRTKKR